MKSIKKNIIEILTSITLLLSINSCSNLIVKLEKANTPTTYMVKHFQQNLYNDEYVEIIEDSQILKGKIGSLTEAVPNEYKGFTAKEIKQKKISSDGKTVVEVFYDRKIITYTFYSGDEGVFINGETCKTLTGRYGSLLNPDPPVANHQSYLFDNWGVDLESYFDDTNKSFYAKYKYNFYEEPVKLPEGTDGKSGPDWTYVYFGVWPQTIKAENIEVYEDKSITMGGNTYYLGSDKDYYVKCLENACGNNYKYSDGTRVSIKSQNSIRYFKVEPIKWRVVTANYNNTNKSLLLAESILTSNIPYYGTLNDRRLNNKTIYANNYKYSNIRAYLNGIENQFVTDGGVSDEYTVDWTGRGFLQSAFTLSAQKKIERTLLDNSQESVNAYLLEPKYNQYICDNTWDKIFCLSISEVTAPNCGFYEKKPDNSSIMRQRYPTDYAKANHAEYDKNSEDSTIVNKQESPWLLRSPRPDGYEYAFMVHMLGQTYYFFTGKAYMVNMMGKGVVPALVVSLPQ